MTESRASRASRASTPEARRPAAQHRSAPAEPEQDSSDDAEQPEQADPNRPDGVSAGTKAAAARPSGEPADALGSSLQHGTVDGVTSPGAP